MSTGNGNGTPAVVETTALQPTTPTTEDGLKKAIATAERYVLFQDRIRQMALKVTSPTDWIDEGGKPYLQWSGAAKIARAFGVSYTIPAFEKETISDEHGDYMQYACAGTVTWNGQEVPEVGTASSRDSLFGVRTDKQTHEKIYLPLSEINAGDVKKKCMTNFLNRGIKSLIGLSFTWDEIEAITNGRIGRGGVTGVAFDKGKKGGNTSSAETTDMRSQIRSMCLDMANGDGENAKAILVELTAWTNKEGKSFPGKQRVEQLTDNQVSVIYGKTKARHEDWKKTIAEAPGAEEFGGEANV